MKKGASPGFIATRSGAASPIPSSAGAAVILSDDLAAYLRELPILGVRDQRNTA